MIEVIQAQQDVHASDIRDLFWEYLQWANAQVNKEFGVNFDIQTMLEQDMADLDKFMPASGRLLLCNLDAQWAGVVCLKRLEDDMGEIERMYVRPPFRRCGVGRALLNRLIAEATQIGYERLRLDSARFMKEAHALYRSAGFREIAPYEGSQIPKDFQSNWIFMEKNL
jgi:GNAT superfamily N-acetyltransferase